MNILLACSEVFAHACDESAAHLGEVVGADALGAVPRPDEPLALGRLLSALPLPLRVKQPRTKNLQRLRLVLVLRPLVLPPCVNTSGSCL